MNVNHLPPPPSPDETVVINPNIPPPPDPHADIALSGLKAQRRNRAESTIARMDHKDRLYNQLGNVALIREDARIRKENKGRRREGMPTIPSKTNRERPQSFAEHFIKAPIIDRRMLKKNHMDADLLAVDAYHGPDRADPVPSMRHATIQHTLGYLPGSKLRRPRGQTLLGVAWKNFERIFVGAKIPGSSNINKLLRRIENRYEFFTRDKTVVEARRDKQSIEEERGKYGSKAYRRARRKARKHHEKAMRSSQQQPILSPWRSMRRNRAQKKVDRIDAAHERQVRADFIERYHKMRENQARAQALVEDRQNQANNDPDNS